MYDDLLASIPENLSVLDCLVGMHWTLIRSEKGTGMARTITGGPESEGLRSIIGMPLKRMAELVKSPNLLDVSLGMAAINSGLNHQDYVEEISEPGNSNVFDNIVSSFVGKKVAMVGHFPRLEPLGEICQLSIIDREPGDGHFPEAVCEHLLPIQDFVFITGTTFIYKTAPRLIELSKNAEVTVLGACVPLSPILFNYGVDTLAGVVVTDEKELWQAVREGGRQAALTRGTQSVIIHR